MTVRLSDYYSQIVRDGRSGRPTMAEARADFRRDVLARQVNPYRIR